MNKQDRNVIDLIVRSKDAGEGWRKVSPTLWPLIEQFKAKELLDIDELNKKVRLNKDGLIVAKYL